MKQAALLSVGVFCLFSLGACDEAEPDNELRSLAEAPDPGDPIPVPPLLELIAFEAYGAATPSCSHDGVRPAPIDPGDGVDPVPTDRDDGSVDPVPTDADDGSVDPAPILQYPSISARMDGETLVLTVHDSGAEAGPAVHVANNADEFRVLNATVNICVQSPDGEDDCAHVVLADEAGTAPEFRFVPPGPAYAFIQAFGACSNGTLEASQGYYIEVG